MLTLYVFNFVPSCQIKINICQIPQIVIPTLFLYTSTYLLYVSLRKEIQYIKRKLDKKKRKDDKKKMNNKKKRLEGGYINVKKLCLK